MKKFTSLIIPVLIAGMLLAYSSDVRRTVASGSDGIRTARSAQKQQSDGDAKSTLSGTREYTSSLDVKEAIRIDINEKLLREKRLLETMRKPPDLIPFSMINSTVRRTVQPVQGQDADKAAVLPEMRTWHKPEKSLYIPGEVLIQLKQNVRTSVSLQTDAGIARFGIASLDMLGEQYRVTAISPVLEAVPQGGEAFGLDLIFIMEVSDDTDIEALAEVYRTVSEVDEVSPNYIPFKHDARQPGRIVPDDPLYDWSDSIVKGPECWDIPETGDNSVILAVLDVERLYETHPDLDGNYLGMKGGIVGTLDHGTMCISVACAELNNATGISGLSGGWDGTQGVQWTGYVFANAADNIVGINWVTTTAGADIITESIGFSGNPAGLESAFEWAYSQGVLSFASAGNDAGSTEPGWPAYYGVVMAVGGVSPGGELWDWGTGVGSNVGEYVDIMGPGNAQYTCDSTGYTNGYGGTSFATPAAAACAALMLSDNNSLTPAQLRERMIRAADYNEHKSPEYSGLMGAGIVNLYEAVTSCDVNVSINEMLDVPGSAPAYSGVYPRALVQNRGTAPATFQVIAQAEVLSTIIYADTLQVTDLPPNNEYSQHAEFIEFERWMPIGGTYTFRIFTNLPGDMNTENDTLVKTVIATSGGTDTLIIDSDIPYSYGSNGSPGWAEAVQIPIPQPCSVMAILYLPGDPDFENALLNWRLWEDNGSSGSPGTLVQSADAVTVTYDAWNQIDITPYYVASGYLYPGWADIASPFSWMTCDDALNDYNWWYNGSWVLDDFFGGDFMIRLVVKLPPKNNHDVASFQILSPGIDVISSMPYIPECVVKNIGKNTESFPVYFTVDSAGTQIYSQSASVTDLAPDVRDTVSFASWIPQWNGGTYNTTLYTALTGDESVGNDTMTMDAACSIVDTLFFDSGVFAYTGGDSAYFTVRFTVDKPIEITGMRYYCYLERAGGQAPNYVPDTIFIWDGDAGDVPGTQLYLGTHTPPGPNSGSILNWYSYSLSENIVHGPGDFWVGVWQPGFVGASGGGQETYQYVMLDAGTEVFRSLFSEDNIDWFLLDVDAMIQVFVQYDDNINTHDVMTTQITEPPPIVSTLHDYDITARVKNIGANTETFDVVARIAETGGSLVYYETENVAGLDPGATRDVSFPAWQPDEADAYYNLAVYTTLGTDVYPDNDTAYQDSIYSTPNDIIRYDNGTAAYYWGDPDYPYTGQRFSPSSPGWLIGCWVAMQSDVTPWPDCSIFVWDDDDGWNDGGLPDPDAVRLSGVVSFDPGGTGSYWFYVTFPPIWTDTTSDFFIGVWNAEPPYILLDNATYEWRSFCAEHPDSAWQPIDLDLLLQAVMRYEYGDAPESPYIYAEKTAGKDSVRLYWDAVTQDTAGELTVIEWYEIYADDDPGFIPASGNWLDSPSDTCFVDPITERDHFYLNHAVSVYFEASEKSNMGYAFHKTLNENAGTTSDRNWVSLPWHSEYATVSDLTNDLSPAGDPIIKITNLQDDQYCVSWIWDPDMLEWYGTDFAIEPGRAYEMVTSQDDTILLVGSNDPEGEIALNENAGPVSDRNWVSIPYNAVYETISDITAEYSPTGDPLIKITNLRDDQYCVSWIWDPYFLEWYGTNFTIEPGRAYEFVAALDTFWNPTEYTNEAFDAMLARRRTQHSDVEVHAGTALVPNRQPCWTKDGKEYRPRECVLKNEYVRDGSTVSHIIHGHFTMPGCEHVVFTAYPVDRPYDVLTDKMIGCGTAYKDEQVSVWFDAGNFIMPWKHGEEVLLIIEALHQGRAYCTVHRLTIDAGYDIQLCDDLVFMEIPQPFVHGSETQWQELVHDEIIGYSIYQGDERVNNRLVETNSYRATEDISVKPVFTGGFETVYSSRGGSFDPMPRAYSFTISPNPFVRAMHIQYALPEQTTVNVKVYDVTGAKVKTLIDDVQDPGYYSVGWQGEDDRGRTLAAGVYFVTVRANQYSSKHKVVFVR